MSDARLIGYVEYDPDGDEDDDAHTLCLDCARDTGKTDGKRWAALRDEGYFGADVPFPNCRECDESIQPDIIFEGVQ